MWQRKTQVKVGLWRLHLLCALGLLPARAALSPGQTGARSPGDRTQPDAAGSPNRRDAGGRRERPAASMASGALGRACAKLPRACLLPGLRNVPKAWWLSAGKVLKGQLPGASPALPASWVAPEGSLPLPVPQVLTVKQSLPRPRLPGGGGSEQTLSSGARRGPGLSPFQGGCHFPSHPLENG